MNTVRLERAEDGIAIVTLDRPGRLNAINDAFIEDLHGVLELAQASFVRRLHEGEGAAALDYLRRRGLSPELIARFGLGWSGDGRGALTAELGRGGVEPARMGEAGLLRDAGVQELVVVGLATDYCVRATALEGREHGWPVTVPWSAVAAVDLSPGDGERTREELLAAGVTVE